MEMDSTEESCGYQHSSPTNASVRMSFDDVASGNRMVQHAAGISMCSNVRKAPEFRAVRLSLKSPAATCHSFCRRVLGVGASFSEILVFVMYDVRYLLIYMVLTGFSAALCLGALYKYDDVRYFRAWSVQNLVVDM